MIDGALMRDTRMVERKKTGSAKARKKVSCCSSISNAGAKLMIQYAWVKR